MQNLFQSRDKCKIMLKYRNLLLFYGFLGEIGGLKTVEAERLAVENGVGIFVKPVAEDDETA